MKKYLYKLPMIMQVLLFLIVSFNVIDFSLFNLATKIVIITVLLLLAVLVRKFVISSVKKRNKTLRKISIGTLVIFYLLIIILSFSLSYIEGILNRITEEKVYTLTSNFMIYDNENIESIKDLNGKVIGLLTNDKDEESHLMAKVELEKNNVNATIIYGLSHYELVIGLVDKTFDAVALPDDFKERYINEEDFKDEFLEIKSIHRTIKELKSERKNTNVLSKSDPFNIVLIGTDSSLARGHHNYDVIMLLTFVPETKDLVITSVYRAAGMYSKCIGGFDLVNHNGWKGWGPECLKETIGDFFEIDIDHYIMIDFNGFVQMVDALGGIEVEVLKDFCEQDSQRKWGNNTICLKKGLQKLNGEQALAFARHRKTYAGEGGIIRSENHITILKAISKRIASSENLFKFNTLSDVLTKNMQTDMNFEQLYALYSNGLNTLKEIDYNVDNINITNLSMQGYGAMLYSPAMNTSVGISLIYQDSYDKIYNTLHTVLEKKSINPANIIFDLRKDPDFVAKVYKSGLLEQARDPRIMQDFVGKTLDETRSFLRRYLYFSLNVEYQHSNTIEPGVIISQSIAPGEGFNHRFRMNVVVSSGKEVIELPIIGDSIEETDE
jgi:LCP family protein required for cell wall assembly